MLIKESSPMSEALIVEYKAIPIQASHPTNPDTLLLLIALSDDSIFMIKAFINLE